MKQLFLIGGLVLYFAVYGGAQQNRAQTNQILLKQRVLTVSGEKEIVVLSDHTLKISDADTQRTEYQYSTADIFLYSVPLGAADQPDRILTVWEGPTIVTHIVVFSLNRLENTPSTSRKDNRVLLDVAAFGLPSTLYVRDAEVMLLPEKKTDNDYVNRIFLWDGNRYTDRGLATDDQVWSKLRVIDAFIKHRNDVHPVTVRP
jgi:hypothetical protein